MPSSAPQSGGGTAGRRPFDQGHSISHLPLIRFLPLRLVLLLAAASGALNAADSATGIVTGRVFNPATGNYVASAEVRIACFAILATTEAELVGLRVTGPIRALRIEVVAVGHRP